jgi:protein-disulfide isomerase
VAQRSRERVEQMRVQQAARRRNLLVSVSILAVLVVVVGVVVAVQVAGSGGTATATRAPRGAIAAPGGPQGSAQRYVVPRGRASAPVTLTIYEDFQCPACRAVETYLNATIDRYVERGTVRVEYHPIAFLDDASTTDYSSRALGAAACVLDQAGVGAYVRMHDLLYAQQPPEGSAGLSDAKLADLAQQAGADRAAVASCVRQGRFAGWVEAATEQASKDGVTATPTILVDGTRLQFSQHEDPRVTLQRAVRAAS